MLPAPTTIQARVIHLNGYNSLQMVSCSQFQSRLHVLPDGALENVNCITILRCSTVSHDSHCPQNKD